MNKFIRYLKVQSARTMKHYPVILIFTAILTLSIALFLGTMFRSKDNEESKKRFEVGLVGDLSGTYMDIGIVAIKNLDSSQYYVEFTEMEEAVAKNRLLAGEIYGYILIPDGFVESVVYGTNKPLTYVMNNSPASLGPVLTNEIIQIVSELIVQSQNGIYGLSDIAKMHNVSRKMRSKAIDDLNMEYITVILNREGFYEKTYVGLGDGLTFQQYYICAFLILLLLLWGIACSSLMVKQEISLQRLLKSNGYRTSAMVLGEYFPFLFMMCINALVLLGFGGTYLGINGLELFKGIIPMVFMITAMQFFLYELSSNLISGVLIQLFMTIVLSYTSGFFYPISSLPEIIQKCSKVLPTGIAFEYLSEVLRERTGWQVLPQIWIYGILFIVLSFWVRQYKMRSNKYD